MRDHCSLVSLVCPNRRRESHAERDKIASPTFQSFLKTKVIPGTTYCIVVRRATVQLSPKFVHRIVVQQSKITHIAHQV